MDNFEVFFRMSIWEQRDYIADQVKVLFPVDIIRDIYTGDRYDALNCVENIQIRVRPYYYEYQRLLAVQVCAVVGPLDDYVFVFFYNLSELTWKMSSVYQCKRRHIIKCIKSKVQKHLLRNVYDGNTILHFCVGRLNFYMRGGIHHSRRLLIVTTYSDNQAIINKFYILKEELIEWRKKKYYITIFSKAFQMHVKDRNLYLWTLEWWLC